MGVFWAGWWILLLGFLPWRLITRTPAPQLQSDTGGPGAHSLTPFQLAAIVAIALQQVVISALALERAPMFSSYPMYAGTYGSPAEWNRSRPRTYRLVLSTTRGDTDMPLCGPDEAFIDALESALEGSPEASAVVWRTVDRCGADLSDARAATVEAKARVFDWERLEYRVRTAKRFRPLIYPRPARADEPER